jgi:hypothetical protein
MEYGVTTDQNATALDFAICREPFEITPSHRKTPKSRGE